MDCSAIGSTTTDAGEWIALGCRMTHCILMQHMGLHWIAIVWLSAMEFHALGGNAMECNAMECSAPGPITVERRRLNCIGLHPMGPTTAERRRVICSGLQWYG